MVCGSANGVGGCYSPLLILWILIFIQTNSNGVMIIANKISAIPNGIIHIPAILVNII